MKKVNLTDLAIEVATIAAIYQEKPYVSLAVEITGNIERGFETILSCYIADTPIAHTKYKSPEDMLSDVRDHFMIKQKLDIEYDF